MREDARADGHTYMTKLIIAFNNFANTTAIYSLYVVQVESLLTLRITLKIHMHFVADNKHEIA
jgi:adenine-specific DNA methylase